MPARRRLWSAAVLIATAGGCAQSGSLLTQRPAVGSLKTSLSHMEYENQQLRRKVADLESENRQYENQLVQVEGVNGELSARLDDAKALLKRRGIDGGDMAGRDPVDDPTERPRALPAGQSNRKKRKAPFAQIPGRLDTLPRADDDRGFDGWGTSGSSTSGDPNAQSRTSTPPFWLPVARGTSAPSSPRR